MGNWGEYNYCIYGACESSTSISSCCVDMEGCQMMPKGPGQTGKQPQATRSTIASLLEFEIRVRPSDLEILQVFVGQSRMIEEETE